jgi:hypothetical protein
MVAQIFEASGRRTVTGILCVAAFGRSSVNVRFASSRSSRAGHARQRGEVG